MIKIKLTKIQKEERLNFRKQASKDSKKSH